MYEHAGQDDPDDGVGEVGLAVGADEEDEHKPSHGQQHSQRLQGDTGHVLH